MRVVGWQMEHSLSGTPGGFVRVHPGVGTVTRLRPRRDLTFGGAVALFVVEPNPDPMLVEVLREFEDDLGDYPLRAIDAGDLHFLVSHAAHASGPTVFNSHLSALRTLFGFAVAEGWIAKNPTVPLNDWT